MEGIFNLIKTHFDEVIKVIFPNFIKVEFLKVPLRWLYTFYWWLEPVKHVMGAKIKLHWSFQLTNLW